MVMLYKKGDQNDLWNYRPVCLLSHAYKTLSSIILDELRPQVEAYLPDLQDGFRSERGCRNATTITHAVMEQLIRDGRQAIATFIDYKDAFSSISHRYLDEALGEAGASAKLRRLLRAILKSATGAVRMRAADGTTECSPAFSVDRGVLQGDVLSPVCFIVGLSMVFRRAGLRDTTGGVAVTKGGTLTVPYQCYADDAALWTEVYAEAERVRVRVQASTCSSTAGEATAAAAPTAAAQHSGPVPRARVEVQLWSGERVEIERCADTPCDASAVVDLSQEATRGTMGKTRSANVLKGINPAVGVCSQTLEIRR
jgi:hypothetical protein